MLRFRQAMLQLIEQINTAPAQQVHFIQPLKGGLPCTLLDWLAAQPLYPRCYWQSRDADQEVVAIGQLLTFTYPQQVYEHINEQQRVWGARSFDGQSVKNPQGLAAFFFLPQLEVVREGQQWQLRANILPSQAEQTLTGLAQLVDEITPLAQLQPNAMTYQHFPDRQHWRQLVDRVLKAIDQQAFKKVVLARQTQVSLTQSVQAEQLLQASLLHNGRPNFHFLLALDNTQSFIGSTPERLYQRVGQQVETEALAGTIGRSCDQQEDEQLALWLIQDVKNLNENQYVVDDIIERLAPYADIQQVQPQAQLVQLRYVQHLKRFIAAQLKPDVHGSTLLTALQPTAAVAGFPRKASLDFIHEHEPFVRGWYAGSVGYFSHQKAEFCVALRSALVQQEQVCFYAGAGIVTGSIADNEWQELDRKVSTLMSLLTHSLTTGD